MQGVFLGFAPEKIQTRVENAMGKGNLETLEFGVRIILHCCWVFTRTRSKKMESHKWKTRSPWRLGLGWLGVLQPMDMEITPKSTIFCQDSIVWTAEFHVRLDQCIVWVLHLPNFRPISPYLAKVQKKEMELCLGGLPC